MQEYPSEKAEAELWTPGLESRDGRRPGTPAKEVVTLRHRNGRLGCPELPLGAVLHRPRPGLRPSPPHRGSGDPPKCPAASRALSHVRSRQPLARPSFAPSPPRAPLLAAQRRLLPGLHCRRRRRVRLGCLAGQARRATGCGASIPNPTAPRGSEVGGRLQGSSASRNTRSPSAPTARHDPGGRGPGGAGRGHRAQVPALEWTSVTRLARSPGTWARGGRRLLTKGRGAPGAALAAPSGPGQPPSSAAPRIERSSGTVPRAGSTSACSG